MNKKNLNTYFAENTKNSPESLEAVISVRQINHNIPLI